MKAFIIKVTYRVNLDTEETVNFMEEVEALRWEMFQKKFGVEPLKIEVANADTDKLACSPRLQTLSN